MKNKIKNSILVAFLLMLTVQVNAQDKGTIRVSAGLIYGEQIEEVGINIGGEYFITSKLTAAPSYSDYLIEGNGSISQINLDARYYLLKGKLQLYGLAGYTSLRAGANLFGARITASEGGANLGAGVVVPIGDKLGFNGQLKYATPGDGQALLQAGLVYRLK
jgi:hypothetical protein